MLAGQLALIVAVLFAGAALRRARATWNRRRRRFIPSDAAVSPLAGVAPPSVARGSICQQRSSAGGHDVSGMTPPSRMMRAQRSRIAANMSNNGGADLEERLSRRS
jgi:hypothetical protein